MICCSFAIFELFVKIAILIVSLWTSIPTYSFHYVPSVGFLVLW
ncbi:hypothetical protein LEP1GSC043_1453 [Leptospira weilii str. Ecochallenge]|uniref:Uncharacterized protein n=1 Tax=Leptospira weilii str. Ecochallenge TaxID=1049986 RepID=N1UBI3_9LEPT|nr:hypothetical protein LEP1GSC051_1203 [Leptospira sp. P2653]EMY15566.1 hypothetical protein LEP1GSC043_1453 [Leptospira weilii str. Ecochallenge]